MEILPYPLACVIAGGFISLLAVVLLLNIFGLPANWIILGLVALWKWLDPSSVNMGLFFWTLLTGIALLGEGMEFFLQAAKAKNYGSSASGTFAGMIGAFAGAILLAPLFWGLGALIGALIGAWAGCLLMELARGRPWKEALDAAFGSLMGKFLGVVCKLGAGAMMIAATAHHIWPARPILSPESASIVMYSIYYHV